jgi:threonyl-tRNA synthetase
VELTLYPVISRAPVVGEEEMNNRSVNVRSRDETEKGRSETMKLDLVVEKLLELKTTKGRVSKLN